jgi:ABC-type uncharacterized transport system ATPase subunit
MAAAYSPPIGGLPAGTGALALDTYELTKRFGAFTAMDSVTMRVEPGTVHALLGENGAGKSTLVKCVAGFQRAEEGSILIDGREQDIANPIVARALGIGMVYQHFTLAPGMTVAENLLLAGGKTPALIDWKKKRAELEAFLATTPFSLDLDMRPSELAAGEKQKLELLKQLYLKPRLLILDEPTSVLTPQEADEVLGHVREFARSGLCTVLIITHKFREVMAYADSVTVLRRGKAVHHCRVVGTSPAQLAQAMMGGEGAALSAPASLPAARKPVAENAPIALKVQGLKAQGDRGTLALHDLSLSVRAGEILGVAGVSGNGQRELVEALVGQRAAARRERDGDGAALQRTARREPSPEGAQPARRAAAQCLRGRPERVREHGAARFRQAAVVAQRGAQFSGLAQPCARVDRRVRRQDAGRGGADQAACRAATCSARCWRASWPATSTC